MQIVRDVDNQFDHAHVAGLSKGAPHKAHIQLQGVDWQVRQHPQRGIACAEVIHLDAEAHAHAAQFLGSGDDLLGIAGIGRFRDLEGEVVGAKAIFRQDVPEHILQVRRQHIDPGHVDGYRHRVAKAIFPVPDPRGGFAPYELIQVQDKAVVLQKRDEYRGADQAQLGMIPAHQRLRAGQQGFFLANVKLGLEVNLESPALQGRFEVFQQTRPLQLRLVHPDIVDADGLAVTGLDRVCGGLGIVKAPLDLKRLVHVGIHTHAQPNAIFRNILTCKAIRCLIQHSPVVLSVRAVDQEGVRAPAAAHAADLAADLPHPCADPGQHAVAVLLSVALIQHVEVVDVQYDGVHGHIGIVLVVHPDIAQEVIQVE